MQQEHDGFNDFVAHCLNVHWSKSFVFAEAMAEYIKIELVKLAADPAYVPKLIRGLGHPTFIMSTNQHTSFGPAWRPVLTLSSRVTKELDTLIRNSGYSANITKEHWHKIRKWAGSRTANKTAVITWDTIPLELRYWDTKKDGSSWIEEEDLQEVPTKWLVNELKRRKKSG